MTEKKKLNEGIVPLKCSKIKKFGVIPPNTPKPKPIPTPTNQKQSEKTSKK